MLETCGLFMCPCYAVASLLSPGRHCLCHYCFYALYLLCSIAHALNFQLLLLLQYMSLDSTWSSPMVANFCALWCVILCVSGWSFHCASCQCFLTGMGHLGLLHLHWPLLLFSYSAVKLVLVVLTVSIFSPPFGVWSVGAFLLSTCHPGLMNDSTFHLPLDHHILFLYWKRVNMLT